MRYIILRKYNDLQKGDTIVEVILATVVIALVITGAYAITNLATRTNQAALERTYASNLLKEQIELIRGIKSSGTSQDAWSQVISKANAVSPVYGANCEPSPGSSPFFIIRDPSNLGDGTIVKTYPTDGDPADDIYQMWVEAYRPTGAEYIDFHARACWEGQGDIGDQREAIVLRIDG